MRRTFCLRRRSFCGSAETAADNTQLTGPVTPGRSGSDERSTGLGDWYHAVVYRRPSTYGMQVVERVSCPEADVCENNPAQHSLYDKRESWD